MALGNVTIEGAQLVLRNFSGKPSDFNAEGDRNTGVILPAELAQAMMEDGWPVKKFKDSPDGGEGDYWIPVSVKYRDKLGQLVKTPPRVVMITKTDKGMNRTPLGEQEIEMLDWADIKEADIIIRPYEWAVRSNSGVKAYVQSLFAVVELDALEQKYQDVPVSGHSHSEPIVEPAPWDE